MVLDNVGTNQQNAPQMKRTPEVRASRARTRVTLGPKFSEGSRQIWLRLEAEEITDEEFTRRVGWSRGVLLRLKYGDTNPSGQSLADLSRELGIDPDSFFVAPLEEFIPPAARSAA